MDTEEDAFVEVLRFVVRQQVEVQSLVPVLSASMGTEQASTLEARLVQLFETPVHNAQATGRLRFDFEPSDILWLLDMLGTVLSADDREQRQQQAERALSIVLNGLLTSQ